MSVRMTEFVNTADPKVISLLNTAPADVVCPDNCLLEETLSN